MRFVGLEIVLVAILTVSTVKSECVTYVECLGTFFGSFFSNYKSLVTESQVGNVTVPGFDTVKVGDEDLSNLLSGVSDFVQEELDGYINFGPQLNVFQNVGNITTIYVKSITINNNFGDDNHENISKNETITKKTILQSPISTDSPNTFDVTKSANFSNNNTQTNKLLINELNEVKENEILDADDPFGLLYEVDDDDNSTDYLQIDYLEMYKDTTNEYTDVKLTESPIDIIKVNDHITEISSKRPDAITFGSFTNNSIASNCPILIILFLLERAHFQGGLIVIMLGSNDDILGKLKELFKLYRHTCSDFGFCIDNTSKCEIKNDVKEAIFPWIAAIFIKNDTSDQFDYYCDGALLSPTIVITAARCMEYYGSQVVAKNLLVLLGKSSLQSMSGTERAVKVNTVMIHEDFKKETSENDIAILSVEEVMLNDRIQTACLGSDRGFEAVTTGWAISGELTVIPFDIDYSSNCKVSNGNNTFCSAYGNDVSVCPSYGGVYAATQGTGWYLRGIRSGDPSDRGLCFDRTVYFTDLRNYVEWINDKTMSFLNTDW